METTRDDPDRTDVPARTDRCAELTLADGGIVIYDTDNHCAWIQSSDALLIDDLD
ncbi:MAG: DUF7331 family protein [Natronomonas sp.]